MYPHRIRLRGPWEVAAPPAAAPRRLTLPCPWEQLVPPDYRGPLRLLRPFGYPGRLDEDEQVWLTCSGVRGRAEVVLNGQPLGAGESSFEFPVKPLLGPRNRLEMTFAEAAPGGPVWDEVALEVRRAAFLRASARRTADAVEVQGVVIGPAGTALELYALVDGRSAHYQTIEPDPAGRGFHFTLTGVAAGAVRLDLVHVATSWYAVEVPIMPA